MKRILKYFVTMVLSLVCFIGITTNAYAAEVSLVGPSTVRGGDTITLNLRVNDDGKYGLEGTLEYDATQVSLVSATTALSGWKIETSGNAIIAYDDALANPLSGTKNVATLTFKVAEDLEAGTKVNISVSNITTTDGTNEGNLGNATYVVSLAKELSGNANLESLTISNLTLNPEFASGTTSYDLGEVEYSVSKLSISYVTEDATASVSIKGNSLKVGDNIVSVVVTAENGDTKTYRLNVTRKQDPNYVASSNANLASITLSHGMISPLFSEEITDYVVYLPYECVDETFSVTGKKADSKAQGVVEGKVEKLVEGINQTTVVCRAEDGTEKIYAITIVVMPEYTGELPSIGDVDDSEENTTEVPSEQPTEEPTETESVSELEIDTNMTEDTTMEEPTKDANDSNLLVTIIVIIVVIALIGALIYVLFFSKKKF